MKTDRIEKKLGESAQRQKERLALWEKIKTVWGDGRPSSVEGLLGEMATSLEERKSRVSARLAEEMGVNDVENQES